MCKIRSITDNSKKLLKVINISELDIDIVDEVVSTMNKVNSLNITGLMKYYLIENDENVLYRIMDEYKFHLDRINPIKRFEENGSFDVLNGILNVLKGLDENKTFHSDLKPSNIFLNEDNEVIISDYCNNLLYKGKEGKKIAGKIEDFCFVCIDELLGKEIDISSDIWNFGLLFYYINSGKYPFVGENIAETIKNILNVDYVQLDSAFGSDGLNSFLSKVLVKQKKQRLTLKRVTKELNRLNQPELPVTPYETEEPDLPSIPATPVDVEKILIEDWMSIYIN